MRRNTGEKSKAVKNLPAVASSRGTHALDATQVPLLEIDE
jgi:hypothetical protein